LETKELDKVKFRTALHAAISYLIGMGIIENDGDVADKLKMEKGNLSNYKNGKKPYNNNLVVKFEQAYGLNLMDFDPKKYKPLFGIQEKSGPSQVPDHLLNLVKTEADNIRLSLQRLETNLFSMPDPRTNVGSEGFQSAASDKKTKSGKR
jgi:hypothetical protein